MLRLSIYCAPVAFGGGASSDEWLDRLGVFYQSAAALGGARRLFGIPPRDFGEANAATLGNEKIQKYFLTKSL